MTEDQIKMMAGRFLSWPIPEDFRPDCGISFEPHGNAGTHREYKRFPTGTNLLNHTQAVAMVRYMVEVLPTHPSHVTGYLPAAAATQGHPAHGASIDGVPVKEFRWLIEAPGEYVLTVRNIGHHHRFHWSINPEEAIRFETAGQADAVMMAVRNMSPELFAFAVLLGDARAREHRVSVQR